MGTLHIEEVSLGIKRTDGNRRAVYALAANGNVYRYVQLADDTDRGDCYSAAEEFTYEVYNKGVINTKYWTKVRAPRTAARGQRVGVAA